MAFEEYCQAAREEIEAARARLAKQRESTAARLAADPTDRTALSLVELESISERKIAEWERSVADLEELHWPWPYQD